MESLLIFLILFPLLIALFMFVIPQNRIKDTIIKGGSIVICAVTILLLAMSYGKGAIYYSIDAGTINLVMLIIELAISLFILYLCYIYKQYVVALFAVIQTAILLFAETFAFGGHGTGDYLFIDELSMIMALIIGIIGSLICIYSIGYMRDYHADHKDVKDKRSEFFFMLFLFLSAMFGLVFSNNLMWIFFFWELTTLCSFLLIGYSRTEQATKNAFWALLLNLIGGVAFAGAILYILSTAPGSNYMELSTLLKVGPELGMLALVPAGLIGFAGLTKSAQMPFSSWLVGAMIAPTPVSALLHSSTMVKAGVYIIVRFGPVFEGELTGMLIALVGGITFLLASCVAVSESNAKKVLAYSTIANLGLVVACAGVGTEPAIWAAILLIIFHAIAKSLLFLSVGTVEHNIHSRDIEDMTGLISSMPRIAVMMLVGIAGMFLAPFGMLISKWATLRAFIEAQPPLGLLLVIIVAFGSAVTVFFWSKWMGKLIEVGKEKQLLENSVNPTEWTALYSLAVLTVLTCILFPIVSFLMIEPYLMHVYQVTSDYLAGVILLSSDNVIIMLMMLFLMLVMPLSMLFLNKGKVVPRYMCGREMSDEVVFSGSLGLQREVVLSNYYFATIFGEKRMVTTGTILCCALIAMMAALLVVEVGL